ncbi:unnamed protein product [Vitrella brassicaformis CCMP3155]|uniref:Anaphase-promoting complex subunit 4 WD40 domain-containing protein n=1 Tax=Vitrella brassicaformis (strain CCMP3155) TaxID=1169540 RepID=A0A0G4F5W8_VITBC|nr:unnamed protein product [Vitrella brassicaformis CCMP3155]|mmetsp:Transcript_18765/g.45174  ORF Transcript_18765/g.45174 Transcript_18765/m.45174 type:complete len:517 (-) Transcript_18765:221-1771(-)|eukprot:CEM07889.1 unnamed protein product [Vitrella brassicaformis CCMP3155]
MGNQALQVTRPVNQVQGRTDLPLSKRPKVVAAFFDAEQGAASGILVITKDSIENFSAKSGIRKYLYRVQPSSAIRCAALNTKSALGPCLFSGCEDGVIRIHSGVTLKLQKEIPAPEEGVDSDASAPVLTCIACPLNNALVCGYADGTLRSFFIETNALACTYRPPSTESAPSSPEPCPSSAVTCVSFYKPKNHILAGHASQVVDASGHTSSLEDVPVYVYSLERGRVVHKLLGARETVNHCDITDTLGGSGSGPYVVACCVGEFIVWDSQSHEILLTYRLTAHVYALDSHHRCSAAAFDRSENVLFCAFDAGCFVSLQLKREDRRSRGNGGSEASPSATRSTASTDGKTGSTEVSPSEQRPTSRITCIPIKLYQVKQKNSEESGLELSKEHTTLYYLWYDGRTQTVVVGDGCGRAKLVPDILNKQTQRHQHQHQWPGGSPPTQPLPMISLSIPGSGTARPPSPPLRLPRPPSLTDKRLPLFSLDPVADIKRAMVGGDRGRPGPPDVEMDGRGGEGC